MDCHGLWPRPRSSHSLPTATALPSRAVALGSSMRRYAYGGAGARLLGSLSGYAAPRATCVWSLDDIKLASMARKGPDTIRVWDAETYEQVHILRDPFRIPTCAFLQFFPDGRRWVDLASPHPKTSVFRVWNAKAGEPYCVLGDKHIVTTVMFDPTSKLPATASDEGAIFLWRMKTVEWMEVVLFDLQAHPGPCGRHATIAVSQDRMQVFRSWAVLSTVLVQVWDPFAGDRFMSLKGRKSSVLSLCFLP